MFLKLNCAVALGIISEGEWRYLSLTTAGSSIEAALGSESATGVGTPALEVTQSGAGPDAFNAVQSAGSAGGITLSKFSLNRPAHGVGVGVVVGATVAVAVGVGLGVRVGVGVGVIVPLGVGVGVGVGHGPTQTAKLVIVSTRHPAAVTLVSEAIRKRSVIVCPTTFGPKFTTVLM